MKYNKVLVALPVKNEFDFLFNTLQSIYNQNYTEYRIYICINQKESFWEDNSKLPICLNNQKTEEKLKTGNFPNITLIDKYSRGNGWSDKKSGAGWARKTLMDSINSEANENDIVISLDADTLIPPGYFKAVVGSFNQYPNAVGLSAPYYHLLTGKDSIDRAILRYEIYLRYYALNMLRINSPYCFTALGSAIAIPIWSYRNMSGITPFKSGEDFYFLQKLAKNGKILYALGEKVFPSSRLSDRTIFGTGQAMNKGLQGDWKSYPLFPHYYFDEVMDTYNSFDKLYEKDVDTPMTAFLKRVFRDDHLWEPIRANYKDVLNFKRSCAAKVDGLRIFQYLRQRHLNFQGTDEESFLNCLTTFYPESIENILPGVTEKFSFVNSKLSILNKIRNFLEEEEMKLKQKRTN